MSCVLRIAAPGLADILPRVSITPYRFENATAHFDVSNAGFDALSEQGKDALAFLQAHASDIRTLMSAPDSTGELDFAAAVRAESFSSSALPAALAHAAGELGLDLRVSGYPVASDNGA